MLTLLNPWSCTPMCVRCGAIRSSVRNRPSSRNSRSPVASNCSSAEPNWKPCVQSVHPRVWYRPFTVNTGAPSAGRQVCSIDRIFAADSSNSRAIFGARSRGDRVLSKWIIDRLLAGVADPPDRVRRVVAHQQRAVLRHRDADRPAPHVPFIDHEAGEEVFVFTGRFAVLEESEISSPDGFVFRVEIGVDSVLESEWGYVITLRRDDIGDRKLVEAMLRERGLDPNAAILVIPPRQLTSVYFNPRGEIDGSAQQTDSYDEDLALRSSVL